MTLPRLLVLTDRSQCAGRLEDAVAAAIDAGARAIVLREKDLPDTERRRLAAEFRALLEPVGGVLIVGGPATFAADDVLHLAARDPFPSSRPRLVGRSCHSAAEVAGARREGCDFVLISPVFPTLSKPGYGPALGPAGLAALAAGAPRAYALGGVLPAHVAECLAPPVWGVAVMGPPMREPYIVAAYLAALPQADDD